LCHVGETVPYTMFTTIDMKLQIVFENSGDTLDYDVVYNHELLEFFINHCNLNNNNRFCNNNNLRHNIRKLITEIHWSLSKINEVLKYLTGKEFKQNDQLLDYLDQNFLNNQHAEWVNSQKEIIDIDSLRFSSDTNKAKLGSKLHEQYPDEIRKVKLAPILEKLGYIFPYEEVNMNVHRLESAFNLVEYSADNKWENIVNPYKNFYAGNDETNFSFSYTYVGRQYYNKFINFDDKLEFDDHYNYETLEHSFTLSLAKPQTIPFSKEFIEWTKIHNIPQITKIPIANLTNLANNLFEYRKLLVRNAENYLSLHVNN